MGHRIIAGADVYSAMASEREAAVRATATIYGSEALPRFQIMNHAVGCNLVKSMYGWSVRYSSGLYNFELLASCRCNQLDGTLEDAEHFAKEWVAKDPTHRYAEIWE